MAYIFPYAGMERPPRPPKTKEKTNTTTHHPRKIAAPVAIPLPEPKLRVPNMTNEMQRIAEEVCRKHRLSIKDLISKSRTHKIIHARREYTFRCRSELSKSFPQIGKSLNQDHTTIVYSYYLVLEEPHKMAPFKRKPAPPRQKVSVEPKKPLERMDNTQLSERQKIVYEYMLLGMSNRKIAEVMGRSYRQARNDTYEVRLKLKRIEMENK